MEACGLSPSGTSARADPAEAAVGEHWNFEFRIWNLRFENRGVAKMARPIPLHLAPRDSRDGLNTRFRGAPLEHAEAVLAAYQVLQGMHDHGVLEVMRGALGGSEKILEQVVAVASGAESIRATRNLLLLVTTLGENEPALLSDVTRAIPKALVQANAEESKPPGLFKLMSTFWNPDFRRGLAAFNDLLVTLGRNLTAQKFRRWSKEGGS